MTFDFLVNVTHETKAEASRGESEMERCVFLFLRRKKGKRGDERTDKKTKENWIPPHFTEKKMHKIFSPAGC